MTAGAQMDETELMDGWAEFRRTGMLWWVNRSLHLFGWAIVLYCDNDGNVLSVCPERVKFRGFEQDDEEDGFRRLTRTIIAESPGWEDAVREDGPGGGS